MIRDYKFDYWSTCFNARFKFGRWCRWDRNRWKVYCLNSISLLSELLCEFHEFTLTYRKIPAHVAAIQSKEVHDWPSTKRHSQPTLSREGEWHFRTKNVSWLKWNVNEAIKAVRRGRQWTYSLGIFARIARIFSLVVVDRDRCISDFLLPAVSCVERVQKRGQCCASRRSSHEGCILMHPRAWQAALAPRKLINVGTTY